MKYKRRIMTSMLALTLLTSGSTVYASDFEGGKISEFKSQVHMRSKEKDEKDDASKKKKIGKKSSLKLHGSQV